SWFVVVCPRDRGERREREACPAPETHVCRQSFVDRERDTREIEQIERACRVLARVRVVTAEFVGRCGLDAQSRLVEGDSETAVEPLASEREVLKAEMDAPAGSDLNPRHTTPNERA